MLRVAGLSKAFGAVRVLHEVELDAATGMITGIIGPNGAGKSTLLYVIGGLLKPDTGRIILEDIDITAVVPYKRALRGLVRTFQISRELGELTVLENLLFARPNQTGESVWKAFAFPRRVRREERAAADRAHAILERVGLWRLADHPARARPKGRPARRAGCRGEPADARRDFPRHPDAVRRGHHLRHRRARHGYGRQHLRAHICLRRGDQPDLRQLQGDRGRPACCRRLSRRAQVNIHGSVVSAREIVLSTEGVAAGYGGDDIISNISVAVGKGSIFTVIGPNGSGKSTFIKVLAGLLPARTGEIRLGAMSIARLSAPQRVAAGLAYVPQEFNIFTNLTVGENLRVSTEFLERERRASAEQRERVLAIFPEVAGRLGLRAGYLSGGQRQMLAFACAMMAAPTVLLLDEPSAGLSPKFVAEIFDKVKSVNAMGVTVVMIEQNVKEALRIADIVLVLVNGATRLLATPDDILTKHDLHKLYLG
ncbi:MAG: ATP-binding cassette domain-containing protein [Alphaproteobacteria bacterium]|nr:MAG: ATP-binding cassette domain-containing protein [Alphaproteobacteria bacterium]